MKFLYYINVQYWDKDRIHESPQRDGWFNRGRALVRTVTPEDALILAKHELKEAQNFDPSLGGFLDAGKKKFKYRVRIRKIVQYNEAFIY